MGGFPAGSECLKGSDYTAQGADRADASVKG